MEHGVGVHSALPQVFQCIFTIISTNFTYFRLLKTSKFYVRTEFKMSIFSCQYEKGKKNTWDVATVMYSACAKLGVLPIIDEQWN